MTSLKPRKALRMGGFKSLQIHGIFGSYLCSQISIGKIFYSYVWSIWEVLPRICVFLFWKELNILRFA